MCKSECIFRACLPTLKAKAQDLAEDRNHRRKTVFRNFSHQAYLYPILRPQVNAFARQVDATLFHFGHDFKSIDPGRQRDRKNGGRGRLRINQNRYLVLLQHLPQSGGQSLAILKPFPGIFESKQGCGKGSHQIRRLSKRDFLLLCWTRDKLQTKGIVFSHCQ